MFINLKELTKYLQQNGSKDLEVTHIHSGDKCFLAYQFYLNINRLNYTAFINKESLEIERFDEDIDNDEFEDLLEHWTIRKLFKGDGVVGQKVQYMGESNRFLTKDKWYEITRVMQNVGSVIHDDLNEPVVIDTKLSHWYS